MISVDPQRTHPRDWGIRTKAAVILAVPLLMLCGFGGVQVANDVQHASETAALAEQISALPAIMRYITSVGATVGADEFGFAVDEHDSILGDYTEPVKAFSQRRDLDPAIAEGFVRMLADGQELTRTAALSNIPLPTRVEQVQNFDLLAQHTIRSLIGQTENAIAVREAGRLLDLWQARHMAIGQAAVFTQSVADSDVAHTMLETAFASERAALTALSGTADDQQLLAEWRAAANRRHALLLGSTDPAARAPELSAAVLAGANAAEQLFDATVDRIVTELNAQSNATQSAAVRTAVIVVIAVVSAIAITAALAGLLVSSLRRLRDDTTRTAYHDLPAAVAAIRADTDPTAVTLAPIDIDTTEEIGQVARAVDGVNTQALVLAAEQATLRRQITTMLETLARRNRSLVDRQLALIEALEFHERDPRRLQNLFELDHLAARMRRTGESLLVLAGTRNRRSSRADTPLEDIMRASVSQVENYERVRIGGVPPLKLIGGAVDDLIHLLTELLDNALRASDPNTTVAFVVSPAVDHGWLLEIVDRGIGIPPVELERMNQRLSEGAETDAHATRHMGLYVVGRVALRHGLQIRLRSTVNVGPVRGITASVYLPATIFAGPGVEMEWSTVDRPQRLPDPLYADSHD
ncbi:sensor histidine kinase [Rhodococcus sp. B50]|uniref:sensor histidine kinase n=1 Tax=Rhodococcus sp. B50 TaxID=2682847 RepID=UPI001BD56C63|nr:ATP-binding protein [Rhodococcus sp. B50]MBS9376482.1 hypothetical protein [Rhodococcus sp. B50]